MLQITAPVSSGSSGSPVMLENGDVVAIASSVLVSGQALNFSVPVSVVHSLLQKIQPAQKLMSFPKAKSVGERKARWTEIGANLLISLLVFSAIYLGWHFLVARRQ